MSAHTSGALKGSLGVTLPECPAEGEQGQLPIPGAGLGPDVTAGGAGLFLSWVNTKN